MMNSLFKALIVLVSLTCASLPAQAHRIGVPTSTLELNENTGTWELTHRVSVHDFDTVLAGKVQPERRYSSQEGIVAIGQYMIETFQVRADNLDMTFVGAELDGDFVFAYFELQPTHEIYILNNVMLDLAGIEEARLNVKQNGETQSFRFTNASAPIRIELSPAR